MSTLPAPIYTVYQFTNELDGLSRPEGNLRNKRYQVHKFTRKGWPVDDREVVFDTGIVQEHYASSVAYQTAKDEAARLNQASFADNIHGRRFTRYETDSYLSVSETEMRRHQGIDHTPDSRLRITPDVETIYIDRDRILWSDGRITKKSSYIFPSGGAITPDAFCLIRYALETSGWRSSGAWKTLLRVEYFTRETVKDYTDNAVGIGYRETNEYKIERLTTDTARILYLVSVEGGGLGEDGDSWESYWLFDSESEAQAQYRSETLAILREMIISAARKIENWLFDEVAAAWPTLAQFAQSQFQVKLPLQSEFRDALADPDEPRDEHGWAMYLQGFAKGL